MKCMGIMRNVFNPIHPRNPIHLSSDNDYDIVKAHGGEIKVETSAGKGSEFIIQLPVV